MGEVFIGIDLAETGADKTVYWETEMTDSWEARRDAASLEYAGRDGLEDGFKAGADFGFEQGRLAEREARQKAEAELALLRKVPEAEGCLNCAAYLEGSAEWKDEARKARAERDELKTEVNRLNFEKELSATSHVRRLNEATELIEQLEDWFASWNRQSSLSKTPICKRDLQKMLELIGMWRAGT